MGSREGYGCVRCAEFEAELYAWREKLDERDAELTTLREQLAAAEDKWRGVVHDNTALRCKFAAAVERAEAAEAVVNGLPERVYRICEKCNMEYRVPMKWTGNAHVGFGCNFCECPNCGERDDPWVLIKLEAAKQKGGA